MIEEIKAYHWSGDGYYYHIFICGCSMVVLNNQENPFPCKDHSGK